MLKLFAMILMLGIALPTWAKDATACIKLGVKEKSQTLTNICDKRVHVIWCHSPTPKDRDAECERNNRFFKQNTVLKPGEMTENMFSLPLDTTITYGACEGGWFTTEPAGKNTNNEFFCNANKTADGNLIPFTVTVANRNRDEACKSAQSIALEEAKGKPSECECEAKGNVSICRVEVLQEKPSISQIGKVKAAIHEKVDRECQRDPKCANTPERSASTGTRN